MHTTLRINASELPDLIAVLKTLFKKEKVVEITLTATPLPLEETKEEYWEKLKKRLKNLDVGKKTVTFNEKEFDDFSDKLSVKHRK